MDNRIRRNLAAGVVSSLLMFLAWLVATEPLLAAPPNSAVSRPLPLVFEENRGQADPRVKFLARGPGYVLFITPGEAVLADRRTGQAVRVHLRGARANVEVAGLEPLPGRIHYIRGRDHAEWRTDVATYARVAYREAYPGIDAIYKTATGSRFEQEFLVRPNANPAAIRLAFEGIQKVAVDDAGNLVLTTAGAPVRLGRPAAYQEIEGVRRAVSVAWSTRGSKEAGFRLGPYDRAHALVIDPVITWATYLGGNGADEAFAIAVDSAGNSYVTGDTDSINFPTTDGSRLAIGASMTDVFVTKLNPTGQALVYSIYIGGSGTDGGRGIAVDPSGNAYVAGFTASTDFPTTAGAFQPRHGGGSAGPWDAFVLKLSPEGALSYSTYLGGRDDDVALGVAVDAAGRAHVVGGTRSPNFPVANAAQPLLAGGGFDLCGTGSCPRNAFVTRLDPQGIVEYSTFLGGASDAVANAIALDDRGSVYVTGSTGGSFPTTPGSFQPNFGGGSADAFVAQIDESAALGWATYLGGTDLDIGFGIAVDRERRPHVVGSTFSTNFPVTGGDRFAPIDNPVGFMLTLRADGSAIDWSRSTSGRPGGRPGEGVFDQARNAGTAEGVAVDDQGRTHLVGSDVVCASVWDYGPTCRLQPAPDPSGICCEVDVTVETRDASGEWLSFIALGGDFPDIANNSKAIGRAIAASGSSLWVTGVTYDDNFRASPGSFQSTAPGGMSDAFVVRLDPVAADGGSSGNGGGNSAGGDGSGGKCLIATAAFGSPLAWEVTTLRRFRDHALLTHAPGRLLVRAYYRLSPPLARAVASQPLLAALVRVLLRPVAFGADFAMNRPVIATGLLAGVGLAAVVGLAVMRGKNARRIRAAAVICLLLGGVLLVVVLALSPRRMISPSLVDTAPVGRSGTAQRPPGQPETAAAPGRSQTAQTTLDFSNLVRGKVSVTPLNPFASRAERRFAVTSELIEGILSADGFVVTDPRRARALGIEAGDTVVRINGYPPTGLLAAITALQRDPDRAAVVLEIDRGGTRIVQSHRVR